MNTLNDYIMKRNIVLSVFILLGFLFLGCKKNGNLNNKTSKGIENEYFVTNIKKHQPSPGLTLLDVKSYQQTTEYTCGPSSVITVLNYYKRTGNEMKIASEMGTDTTTGTTPEQLLDSCTNRLGL